MNIEEKENALFERWIAFHKECIDDYNEDLFCSDGLHFLGKPKLIGNVFAMERDYSEELKWKNSNIRPLFLTKDHNLQKDKEGVKVRTETGLNNSTGNLYRQFYKKYLLLVYGLYRISQCHNNGNSLQKLKETISTSDISHRTLLEVFHRDFAVVRMNLKKIAGENACSDTELQIAINRDFDFIKEQIALYRPNVIVCCHGKPLTSNPIMQMLMELYPDLQKQIIEGYNCQFIYWSEKEHIIVLHEWHPSYWSVSDKDYFEAIPQLVDFCLRIKHPI